MNERNLIAQVSCSSLWPSGYFSTSLGMSEITIIPFRLPHLLGPSFDRCVLLWEIRTHQGCVLICDNQELSLGEFNPSSRADHPCVGPLSGRSSMLHILFWSPCPTNPSFHENRLSVVGQTFFLCVCSVHVSNEEIVYAFFLFFTRIPRDEMAFSLCSKHFSLTPASLLTEC